MIIALARHGQTDYNVALRFQGQTAVPLNARGIEQAHELAAEAAKHEWGALYCSPLTRARQTAEIVGERIGLEPIPDERFKETDTGDWTDLTHDEVRAKDPEAFAHYERADADFGFPGGETLEQQLERVVDGLVSVTQAGKLPALVVCHRGVIRVALCHTQIRGLDMFMEIEVPNGSLVAL
ncbi:histidine phosphatase family protein [Paraconexibacter sp.]|uniref:histidine phosphatase family protein n=1 Tax=Paraconexibacter sp. TaxID=2949640 RepID=UPI00356ABFEF